MLYATLRIVLLLQNRSHRGGDDLWLEIIGAGDDKGATRSHPTHPACTHALPMPPPPRVALAKIASYSTAGGSASASP
jgi:hypothetical protein